MTAEQHRDQAKARIGYSDEQWLDSSDDLVFALGSVRQAIVALAEAVLALSAMEQVETGGNWPASPNRYPTTGGTL